ncbi:DUF2218 domain-containing protein (plasmid) [Cereibacter azotoformans]|uniref:DUF2218 domain-containing protein n=1 Tax=Cereibacter TaxID=1653176 RepID=UPI0011A938E0|nr:DUF2218 domain-containing protein [Cereibacter sediminicola]
MLTTTARYATPHAAKYLRQLGSHFAHKVEVQLEDHRATCTFLTGTAALVADEGALTVRIEAPDPKGLIQTRFVIDSHLVTFAFREAFTGLDWSAADGDAAPDGSHPAGLRSG